MPPIVPITFSSRGIPDIIRVKCHEGYSSQTILRELLQNADDAEATEATLQIVDNPPGPPGLLWHNNGHVEEEDLRRLSQFLDSSRAEDPNTIGAFGLGKMVLFHWGEGFWVYAQGHDPQCIATYPDPDDQDANALNMFAGACVPGRDPNPFPEAGLTLWIPLRTAEMCPPKRGPVLLNRPHDIEQIQGELEGACHRVAIMLPLLRSMKKVSVIGGNGRTLWEVALSDEATRRHWNPETSNLCGIITITKPRETVVTRKYWGLQINGEDSRPPRMPDGETPLEGWRLGPKDADGAEPPVARHAHAAVIAIEGTGTLDLECVRAAFLPLGDSPQNPEAPLLILHANATLDDTRTRFMFPNAPEDPLWTVAGWNWKLWSESMLPLIPEVSAAAKCDVSILRRVLGSALGEQKTTLSDSALRAVEAHHCLVTFREGSIALARSILPENTLWVTDFKGLPEVGDRSFRMALRQTLVNEITPNGTNWSAEAMQALAGYCKALDAGPIEMVLAGLPQEQASQLTQTIRIPCRLANPEGQEPTADRRPVNEIFELSPTEAQTLSRALNWSIPFLDKMDHLHAWIPAARRGLAATFDGRCRGGQAFNAPWDQRQDLAQAFQEQHNWPRLRSVLAGRPLEPMEPLYRLPEAEVLRQVAERYLQFHPGTCVEPAAAGWLDDQMGLVFQQNHLAALDARCLRDWAHTDEGENQLTQWLIGQPDPAASWELLSALRDGQGLAAIQGLPFFPLQGGGRMAWGNGVFLPPLPNENWQWETEAAPFPGPLPPMVAAWPDGWDRPQESKWNLAQGVVWVLEHRANNPATSCWLLSTLAGGVIQNFTAERLQTLRTTAWLPLLEGGDRAQPAQVLWHLDPQLAGLLPHAAVGAYTRQHLAQDFRASLEGNLALCDRLFPQGNEPYPPSLPSLVQANHHLQIPAIFQEHPGWAGLLRIHPELSDGLRVLHLLEDLEARAACAQAMQIAENMEEDTWKSLLANLATQDQPIPQARYECALELFRAFLAALPDPLTPAMFEAMSLPSSAGNWQATSTLLNTNELPQGHPSALAEAFWFALNEMEFHWPQQAHGNAIAQAGVEILEGHGLHWVQTNQLESEALLGVLYWALGDPRATAHLPQVPELQNYLGVPPAPPPILHFQGMGQPRMALDGTLVPQEAECLHFGGNENSPNLFGIGGLDRAVAYLFHNQHDAVITALQNPQTVELYTSQVMLQHGIARDVKRLLDRVPGAVDHAGYIEVLHEQDQQLFNTAFPIGLEQGFAHHRAQILGGQDVALTELIEANVEFRNHLADGMKALLMEHHYDQRRVLLELFQNAEDACREAEGLGLPAPANGYDFIVRVHNESLWVFHRGRPINRFAWGGMRDDRFRKDLIRMCSLLDSAKGGQPGEVGHFGLGFKSVYCLTQEPRIRSAGRHYRILGGIWCVAGGQDPAPPLQAVDDQVTCIGLPLRPDIIAEAPAIQNDFLQRAPGLLLTAKKIQRIQVGDIPGNDLSPQILGGLIPLVRVGGHTFWKIVANGCCTLALPVVVDGDSHILDVGMMPPGWPTLWALAPTSECWEIPLLLDAPFKLDSGRLALAKNSVENRNFAESLGASLAQEVGMHLGDLPDAFLRNLLARVVHPANLRPEPEAKAFALATAPLWRQNAFPRGAGLARASANDSLQPVNLPDLGDETHRSVAFDWLVSTLGEKEATNLIRNEDWEMLKAFRGAGDPALHPKHPRVILWPPEGDDGDICWHDVGETVRGLERWRNYSQMFPRDPWEIRGHLRKNVKLSNNHGTFDLLQTLELPEAPHAD